MKNNQSLLFPNWGQLPSFVLQTQINSTKEIQHLRKSKACDTSQIKRQRGRKSGSDCFLDVRQIKRRSEQKERRKSRGGRKEEEEVFIRGKQSGAAGATANIQGRSPGPDRGKVSVVQSALTDVLYIACHFILQEYWGVAKLKPGR